MNRTLRIGGAFVLGILGGLASTFFLHAPAVQAETYRQTDLQKLELFDNQHRLYARLRQDDREGSELCFLDGLGHPRLKMGLQANGLPYLGLYSGDDSSEARAFVTLTGTRESSLLVLRDKWKKKRLVMGLDPEGAAEEPFFAYFDKSGVKHTVFGTY